MTLKTPLRIPTDVPPPMFDDPLMVTPIHEQGIIAYRNVAFARIPGYRPLLLDLIVPPGPRRPIPLVVHVHGGAWLAGTKRILPTDFDEFHELRARLLDEGYAFASVQYRLSAEAPFPAQLHDVKAAIRWLRAAAPGIGLDPDRIGTIGASAGGHLAIFLGANTDSVDLEGAVGLTGVSSVVASSVGWYPPTRLETMQEESIPGTPFSVHSAAGSPESRLIGAPVEDRPDLARAASPIAHITGATAPTLLIHGTCDQMVPHQQSIGYRAALEAAGITNELHLIDGADHCFFGGDMAPILDTTMAFLRVHLGRSERSGDETAGGEQHEVAETVAAAPRP